MGRVLENISAGRRIASEDECIAFNSRTCENAWHKTCCFGYSIAAGVVPKRAMQLPVLSPPRVGELSQRAAVREIF